MSLDVDALYRKHGHVVLRRARHLLGSEEEARDVVHDVFTALLRDPSVFRRESALTTWLYSATTHACLNTLRNRRTRAGILALAGSRTTEADPPRAETAAVVRDLLARLPAEIAQVAVYHHLDEMTHEEIALVLGCSRRHVGDLLERLTERLRKEAS